MEAHIHRCLNYLRININYFLNDDNLRKNKNIDTLKPFVELIFFYNMLSKNIRKKYDFTFIENFIEEKINSISFLDYFESDFHIIAGLATIEEYFFLKGKKMNVDQLINKIELEKIDLRARRIPFRELDKKYSLNRIGIFDNLETYDELYLKTVLGTKLPPFFYTETNMYSVTHTIFYITDMGRNFKLSTDIKDDTLPLLKMLMTNRIIEKDLDILGELILCVLFLNLQTDVADLLSYAVDFILINQNKIGFFPAPIEKTCINSHDEFNNNYHTTIVCLGALLWYQEKKL